MSVCMYVFVYETDIYTETQIKLFLNKHITFTKKTICLTDNIT